MIYPEVHFPMEASLRWRGVESQCLQAPQWLTLFSSCLHQCGVSRSTMGPLRAVTDPVQGWGNLHNLIGGSQQYPASYKSFEIATRSRKLPKLRDNNNRLGNSKYLRGTSFSTSTSTYHRGELKPMQWQEHKK